MGQALALHIGGPVSMRRRCSMCSNECRGTEDSVDRYPDSEDLINYVANTSYSPNAQLT